MKLRVATAATVVVFLAGCSTSVNGTSTAPSTRPTGGSSGSATSAPPSTNGTAKAKITLAKLAGILPTSAEVGPGYSLDSTDDSDGGISDAAFDQAMRKACPEAAELVDPTAGDDNDDHSTSRNFTTDDGRSVEVEFELDESGPDPFASEQQLEDLIDAINACDTIEVQADGYTMAIDLKLAADDTYGDIGATMQMHASMSGDRLPAGLYVDADYRMFQVGNVDVTVSAVSGVDQDTLRITPPDRAIVDRLSGKAEQGIEQLS